MNHPSAWPLRIDPAAIRKALPGIALAAAVAGLAIVAEGALSAATAGRLVLPAMVLALLLGISLHAVAAWPRFEPGLSWCVRRLLRIAIALLGVRIALADIAALGPSTALLVVGAMAATIVSTIWLAARLGIGTGYGALAGAATAVCGASATLATATVVPAYPGKSADVAFAVIAANAVSTLAMLLYPWLATLVGLDDTATGILLGATIHDMAQVVGAGYAVSGAVGNTAVVVKLFRVFLLLPVVLAIGWWLASRRDPGGNAQVPAPMFAVAFLLLCGVNSLVPLLPSLVPAWAALKSASVVASSWGLLLAIAALGLGTSVVAILAIGWRHIAVFMGATLVILLIVLAVLTG